MLVDKTAFDAVGGFDERYFMYCEEADLQLRLRGHGYRITALGSVRLVHHTGGSTDSARALGWMIDSQREYFRKWGGLGCFVPLCLPRPPQTSCGPQRSGAVPRPPWHGRPWGRSSAGHGLGERGADSTLTD